MRKQPVYKRFKYPLSANEEHAFDGVGNLASLLAASGAVEIAFGDGAFIPIDVGQTISFQDEDFDNVRLRDVTGAVNNIDLYTGRGEFFDLRFSTQSVLLMRPEVPPHFVSSNILTADAAVTQVAVEFAARRELLLVNQGLGTVYIGSNPSAAAGYGLPLAAGAFMQLENTSAFYVRNDTGATVLILAAESLWELPEGP